ncbi:MAG: hypothetical protein WC285_03135, partial [Candidatus Gracilibacteria bacterium]
QTKALAQWLRRLATTVEDLKGVRGIKVVRDRTDDLIAQLKRMLENKDSIVEYVGGNQGAQLGPMLDTFLSDLNGIGQSGTSREEGSVKVSRLEALLRILSEYEEE